jgi:energy-coupling factor transporter ATP-binding protein EcfA2
MAVFQKAVKRRLKLRLAIQGPSGSGKTYSALSIARALVGHAGRIAVIDTENRSASKYADIFDFDTVEPTTFPPTECADLIKQAAADGYDAIVIDSLSHYWMGEDGMLEQVDKIAARKQLKSNFPAWKDASPQEKALWSAIIGTPIHVIATMRTKTEYVMEEQVGRDGKKRSVPRKVGLAPVQRNDTEYEFDVVLEMTLDHLGIVGKTRCTAIRDEAFQDPGENIAAPLRLWLNAGEDAGVHSVQPAALTEAAPVVGEQHTPSTLAQSIDAAFKALEIPPAIIEHIRAELHASSFDDLPEDRLGEMLAQLREIYKHSTKTKRPKQPCLTQDTIISTLHDHYGDTDPITRLCMDLAAAREQMREQENV